MSDSQFEKHWLWQNKLTSSYSAMVTLYNNELIFSHGQTLYNNELITAAIEEATSNLFSIQTTKNNLNYT